MVKKAVLACVALFLTASCAPEAPLDDAGNRAFAKRAIVALLGRAPFGSHEIDLVADISTLFGRKWAVRAIMERPEFVPHWQAILYDYSGVQRGANRGLPNGCIAAPLRAPDKGEIGRFLRDHPPSEAVPGAALLVDFEPPPDSAAALDAPFNLYDAVDSMVRADDLRGLFPAHLFPMTYRGLPAAGDGEVRDTLANALAHTYLNRSFECLPCHNALGSTSNLTRQRTWGMPVLAETAVFGDFFANGPILRGMAGAFLRGDQTVRPDSDDFVPPSNGLALRPWGMSADCGLFVTNSQELDPLLVETTDSQEPAFFAGRQGSRMMAADIALAYRQGYIDLELNGLQITGTRESVLAPDETSGVFYEVEPEVGLAYMVAASLADHVWREVIGEPLTIANYYARTKEQMMMRWHLTHFFVSHGFSLKQLLERILLSEYFNRQAPIASGESSPHHLPLMFDPWVQPVDTHCPEYDPDAPPPGLADECRNTQGTMVHQRGSRTLLATLSSALGWQAPRVVPDDSTYPNAGLAQDTGQFLNDLSPGARSPSFQGLLGYEFYVGACANRAPPAGGMDGQDWIDRLVAAAGSAALDPPVSIQDLVVALKDRLIGYPTIGGYSAPGGLAPGGFGELPTIAEVGGPPGEAGALNALFGVPLQSPPTALGSAELELKLRQLCGVLIKTPQFWLEGLPLPDPVNRPRLQVCLPGEPCGYFRLCAGYRNTLAGLGKHMRCLNDAVQEDDEPQGFEDSLQAEVCPAGICTWIPSRNLAACLAQPGNCRIAEALPACSPRCRDLSCCGERPEGKLGPGAFLSLLDGARVSVAERASVLDPNALAWRALRNGEQLSAGQVLRLIRGTMLEVRSGAARLRTPSQGMPSPTVLGRRALEDELLRAARVGMRESVRGLLARGADVDARDDGGRTSLALAIHGGNAAMVELLVAAGADWTIEDAEGESAAALAVRRGTPALLAILRKAGAVLPEAGPYGEDDRRAQREGQLPWYVVVTGLDELERRTSPPDDALSVAAALAAVLDGRSRTGYIDHREVFDRWHSEPLSANWPNGAPLTRQQEQEAYDAYLRDGYALEHDRPSILDGHDPEAIAPR